MSERARAKMPNSQRAKQFMPFDAVSGLQQALRKKEHEMGLISRKELSEETRESINEILSMIGQGDTIFVSYFSKERGVSVVEKCVDTDRAMHNGKDRKTDSGEIIDTEGKVFSFDPVYGTITLAAADEKDIHGFSAETVINIDDIVSIMV